MYLLRIEHPVPSFEGWKRAFDNDPVDRRQAGVRRYRIFRPLDDSDHAMVDLEFDTAADAESMLVRLRSLWQRVEGTVMREPRTRIIELVEETTL
jgi:hypothetical protein